LQIIWARLLTLFLALVIDWVFGEPPEKLHPTVWMGQYILRVKSLALKNNNGKKQRIWGPGIAISTILLFTGPAYVLEGLIHSSGGSIMYILLAAIALKTTFAAKCMHQFAMNLSSAIEDENLEDARVQLTFLVRRDPWRLSQRQMLSAAVESIAEGIVDGAVSPLLYFSLFGLPGAVAYRAINTLDSMVGYKDSMHRELGFFSAKLDTIANYIPARLSALLLVLSSSILGENTRKSLQILRKDHSKTESLNAGWPMSAMAGALGVVLEKKGHYRLGDESEELSTEHVLRALGMHRASILLFSIFAAPILIYLTSNLMGDTGV
jgi:adenosylcobinamide-phosphate synthase